MEQVTTARVDSWIWAVRLAKTRSMATAACKAGHVRINDERAKPSQSVKVGDRVRVRIGEVDRQVEVTRLVVKRVGASVAAECLIDHTPPPPPREHVAMAAVRDRGAGRPTKRERRDIERLRGH
ncbi:RNA-binding S4 domain-containing protein [Planctomonas psychrotolerans]|uniref:RNA-binding S4 domain-containing protein n=1 Tax=Planctomonas psychrotolerans TaxID=2528712 RepID=UPI00123A9F62|nr:RNA-binding S4 domain-containing protein [Planctomonas psychrotolerans]